MPRTPRAKADADPEAVAGATLDVSGVTTTTTQSGQTVKTTIGGTAVESVPVSAQLTLTLVASDGVTNTLGAVTVSDTRATTLVPGTGFKVQSGTLSDGRPVTVASDGLSVSFPA
jgi:hypothetical protein